MSERTGGREGSLDGSDLDYDNLDIPAFMRNKVEGNPFEDIQEAREGLQGVRTSRIMQGSRDGIGGAL